MRKEILEKLIKSKRNNIISGTMSTGKTTNIGFDIVKKIIEHKENLFILDTKEEYLNMFYDKLKEENYKIIIINTKKPLKSNGWNPLQYSMELYKKGLKDESIKYLNSMAEEIFYEFSNADPFWSNMANDFFKGIALSLFEDAREDEVNFRSINSIMTDADVEPNYLEEYFRTKSKNDISYICASPTIFSPYETRGGIISTATSKLNPLVRRDELSALLNKTTYDNNDLLKEKIAVFYICDEMSDINSLVSVYIKELFNILCDNNNKNKFNIILDNFDYINNIIGLKNMLSICVRFNIKFYIFTRDKARLENYYSSYINKLANNIILNEENIKILIANDEIEISNQEIKEEIENIDINYPVINIEEMKFFDLKKYIIQNIKVDADEYNNFKLEEGNLKLYELFHDIIDNSEKEIIEEGKAKFFVVKDGENIIDNFVIFNEENRINIDIKKLLDVNYIVFIFDNLVDYDYITIYIPVANEKILNILKFNFDIESIEKVNQNEFMYNKVKINIK